MIRAQLALVPDATPNEAVFSPCRRWRYLLHVPRHASRRVLFVAANPSKADEYGLDPTLRRELGFARRWGFDGLAKVNLFAYVSTDPRGLEALSQEERVGPENDSYIVRAAASADLIVAAWGVGTGKRWFSERAEHVRRLLGPGLMCLRRTKGGAPEHPLYLPRESDLVPYE